MKYEHISAAFQASPWAILPAKLEEMRAFLRLKVRGGDVDPEEIQALTAGRRPDGVTMAGRVALVPVFGVISQRVGMIERASGGISTEELGSTLDGLVSDKAVKAVCLVFDSPGGSVFGVEELGRKIAGYRGEKKVVAVADSVAASAAYWLASQCQEFAVTPGGQVGSIGVLIAHEDWSAYNEEKGIKTTIVTSAPYKAEMADTAPLSAEALGELQGKVNHYHGLFTAAVARGRGVSEAKVSKEFGQGRMMTAKDAVAAGMADKVATLEQVLSRLGASSGTSAQQASVRARAVELSEIR